MSDGDFDAGCRGCRRAGDHPFDPAWCTSPVVLLGKRIQDEREFGAMPMLADALQEAGCDDEAILNHCRHATEHFTFCWVLALILSSEGATPKRAPVPEPQPPQPQGRRAARLLKQGRQILSYGLIGAP